MKCCICDSEMGKFSMSGLYIDLEYGKLMYFLHFNGVILRIFHNPSADTVQLERAWCFEHFPIEHKNISGWGWLMA
jgi:hypothetical protein